MRFYATGAYPQDIGDFLMRFASRGPNEALLLSR